MEFCTYHFSTLRIDAKPNEPAAFQLTAFETDEATAIENCPALEPVKKGLKAELQDLVSSAGPGGLSAEQYIQATWLMYAGDRWMSCMKLSWN